jgi:hypothetical protein
MVLTPLTADIFAKLMFRDSRNLRIAAPASTMLTYTLPS